MASITHIVDLSSNRSIVIIIPCMHRQLCRVPSLVIVGTQKHPKDDNVEQDDTTQSDNHHENSDFFPPCHTYICPLHLTDRGEEEGRDPPGEQPCYADPPSSGRRRLDRVRLGRHHGQSSVGRVLSSIVNCPAINNNSNCLPPNLTASLQLSS